MNTIKIKTFIVEQIDNGYLLKYDIFVKFYENIEDVLKNIKNVILY